MSWIVVAALAAGVALQRVVGMFLGGRLITKYPSTARLASLIPAAVVAAVVAQLTLTDGTSLDADARQVGMAAAGVLVWRRAPFIVVIVTAAVVTAGLRAL